MASPIHHHIPTNLPIPSVRVITHSNNILGAFSPESRASEYLQQGG